MVSPVFRKIFFPAILWVFATSILWAQSTGLGGQNQIYSGTYQNGQFDSLTFVNSVVGWDDFFYSGYLGGSTVIGNVEAGTIWFGHEVFRRPPGVAADYLTYNNSFSNNQLDFHATTVGHVLAGAGYVAGSDPASFTYAGLGMAPYATVWSGAIATGYSATELGSFDTSYDSTLDPYKAFFNGINGRKADVINSSWGGEDPSATQPEMIALDGLAAMNPTVAFVASAGNSGDSPVSAPGADYNNIAVGSLGGPTFLDPSSFSSRGPADFYNPATNTTLTGVRAAVDLAAPGEQLFLAAYLGGTGSLGASSDPVLAAIVQDPSPTDLYFLNLDGTSYAAPIVSGGIALLKDVANTHPFLNYNANPLAQDTRVIKSVLMAGAQKTNGWNNGQSVDSQGVVVTTQALDYATGAGALNLTNTVADYFFGSRDVAGTGGGTIQTRGWDYGTLSLGGNNDYVFDSDFAANTEVAISLNWFANRLFDNTTNTGTDLSLTNLDLELWQINNGVFTTLVGRSSTLYNNSEFLRLDLTDAGLYGLRVVNNGLVFDLTGGTATSESYGLAWQASLPTPTPIVTPTQVPSTTPSPSPTPNLEPTPPPDPTLEFPTQSEGDIPTMSEWFLILFAAALFLRLAWALPKSEEN